MRLHVRRLTAALSAMFAAGVLATGSAVPAGEPTAAAVPAAPAQAPLGQSCDAVLVDHAGVLSTAESAAIEQAARELFTDLTYDVRIRLLSQDQAPRLEAWVDQEERACTSWQGPTGGFRGNLVVLAFTTDTADLEGETGVYFGERLPDNMDTAMARIEDEVINPALAAGDWQRGVIGGLTEIRDVIDPPAGNAGLVMGGVVVAGVTATGGGVAWRRRRRRQELEARFARTTSEFDTLTLTLDPLIESLRRDIELARTAVAEQEATQVIGSSEELLDGADQLIYRRSELAADRDQVMSRRSLGEVAQGVQAWESLEASARDLLPRLETEESRIAAVLAVRDQAEERLDRIGSLAGSVQEAAASAKAAGFVVATDAAVLDVVDERIREIRWLLDEKRLLAADKKLIGLTADLEAAREALGRLAQREAELRARLAERDRAQEELTAAEATASTARHTLAAEYAENIGAPVAANVDDGRGQMARSSELLTRARLALGNRDLGAAENWLDEVEAAHREALAAFQAVTERLALAERLRSDVPDRRASVAAKADVLEKMLKALGSAAPAAPRQQLSAARSRLAAVDVNEARPDWMALNDKLAAIENEINAATREAEEARRREERRRREAELARQRQAGAVSGSWGTGVTRSSVGRGSSWGGGSRGTGSGGGVGRGSSARRGGTARRSSGGTRRGGTTRRSSGGGRRGGGSRR